MALQEQRKAAIDSPAGQLPVLSLVTIPVSVAVSVIVYLIAWDVFGTAGLLLGWIPAAALGFLAAREIGRRAAT